MKVTAQQIAAKDMAEALKGLNVDPFENFNVMACNVFTSESRRLNKELGVNYLRR